MMTELFQNPAVALSFPPRAGISPLHPPRNRLLRHPGAKRRDPAAVQLPWRRRARLKPKTIANMEL